MQQCSNNAVSLFQRADGRRGRALCAASLVLCSVGGPMLTYRANPPKLFNRAPITDKELGFSYGWLSENTTNRC